MRLFSRSGVETAWSFALPRPDFEAGSYQGRAFLSPRNHLGEDSHHAHHDAVHAIAGGVVREACTASGYGRVVVVEHRLPDGARVCSIYGHLCGHQGFPLIRDGAKVRQGEIVGYVGDRFENGDGLEHLHLGLRKGRYDGYFCGYARSPHCTPQHYLPPTEFIRARGGALRLTSEIEPLRTEDGRNLTYKADVENGFFYGGAFDFRLRAVSASSESFTSEPQKLEIAPGAAASLLFATPLPATAIPQATLELRTPGTAAWRLVESKRG